MAHRDYEEFIAGLNAHRVRYLVVGAHAVGFHARPRATKDLDIFVQPTRANAQRLLAALADFFGGTPLGYTVKDILDPNVIIQLGVAPVRIDLISELIGIPRFAAAWRVRVEARFGRAATSYISLDDLVTTKAAAGRPQDLADLEVLRRVPARRVKSRRR